METWNIIWSVYHALILIAFFLGDSKSRVFFVSMSLMSLMGGIALLTTGHSGWFLGLNLGYVGCLVLAALAAYGTAPPGPENEKSNYIAAAATIRFAVTLACWFLAK